MKVTTETIKYSASVQSGIAGRLTTLTALGRDGASVTTQYDDRAAHDDPGEVASVELQKRHRAAVERLVEIWNDRHGGRS